MNKNINKGVGKIFSGSTISIILFVIFIVIITFFGLKRLKDDVRISTVYALNTVLESTHKNITHVWLKGLFLNAEIWASNENLINNIKILSELGNNKQDLINSNAQIEIRNYFTERLKQHDALGIFIISYDNFSLASMRDANVGSLNLIGTAYPERLKKVFEGRPQFIPPMPSDVPLSDANGKMIPAPPTMFVLTPIKNKSGEIIAALSIRLNPFADFSFIAQTGRIGSSGETYLFNDQGFTITESRFTADLYKIGLLEDGSSSILNLKLTDPGGNLLKGYQPKNDNTNRELSLMAQNAINGNSYESLTPYNDYRGVPVLGAWYWDPDLGIGIATEINEYEALNSYREAKTIIIGFAAILIILIIVSFIFIQRSHQKTTEVVTKSENYLREVFDSAADAIITTDKKGRIISFNDSASTLFGYNFKEIKGKSIITFLPESTNNSFIDELKKSRDKKLIEEFRLGRDFQGIKKDGSALDLRVAVSLIKHYKKSFFIVSCHDISESKQAALKLKKGREELEKSNLEMEKAKKAAISVLYDTDRQKKVAEKALVDLEVSEERTRLLLESASNGIFGTDNEGTITFVNPSVGKLLGFSSDELIGSNAHSLFHHHHANGVEYVQNDCPMYHAFTVGKSSRVDDEVLWTKDGHSIPVEYSATPMKRGDDLIGSVITFSDISERIRAQEEIQESEEKFRGISSSAKDAIIMIDHNDKISFWNNAAETIFGWTEKEIIGKEFHKIVVPERYYNDHSKGFRIFNETGDGPLLHKTVEVMAIRKGSGEFPVEVSISAIKLKGKWNAIGILRDISERKEAEEEIKMLNSAIEQSPVSVVITDLKGTIQYVNPNFTVVTGYSYEEAIGQNPRVLKSDEHSDDFYSNMWKILVSGKIWEGEIVNKKKNGELYWESASISPVFNENHDITNFIAVKSDITEKKKAEEELKQAQSRLTTALETAKMGSWHYSVDTGLFFLDPLIRNIYGFTQDEKVSLEYLASKVHPDDIEHFTKIAGQALNEGLDYTMEYRIIPRKGQVVYLSDYGKVFKNADDKVISVTGLVSDVTDQKKAEEELNQKLDELERFNRLVVGREIRMIELKKEINELQSKLGNDDKYKIVQIEDLDEKSKLNNNN